MEFSCYIWGSNSNWEAICTDLYIAAQGSSVELTKNYLMKRFLVTYMK